MNFKSLFCIIAAALICVCLVSCAGAEKTPGPDTNAATEPADDGEYTIDEMEGKYKTQGRTIMYEKGLAMLSSADIFEFNAECEGTVTVKMLAEETADSGSVDLYFTGYVDGERCKTRYHLEKQGEAELVLATDLEKGAHSFRIVRQTEWNHGDVYLTGVVLDGELTDPPAQKDLYIEFVGDSFTTGFGNLPEIVSDEEWGGAPIYQDATQAYPYLISQMLDADLSVVAIQGIGARCSGQPFTINEVYNTYPRCNENDYTYAEERSADLVIISMLANDGGLRSEMMVKPTEIVEKAKELCEIVREQHPDSVIIFCPGSFPKQVTKMVETELGGAENGYYISDIIGDYDGKSAHCSAAGHKSGSEGILPFLLELIEEHGLRG